jgi:hypothetical protein
MSGTKKSKKRSRPRQTGKCSHVFEPKLAIRKAVRLRLFAGSVKQATKPIGPTNATDIEDMRDGLQSEARNVACQSGPGSLAARLRNGQQGIIG